MGLSTVWQGVFAARLLDRLGAGTRKAPPPGQPNLIFCEEVRVNGAAEDYIAGANLWNRTGQEQAAANRDDIEFPRPAVVRRQGVLERGCDLGQASCGQPLTESPLVAAGDVIIRAQ